MTDYTVNQCLNRGNAPALPAKNRACAGLQPRRERQLLKVSAEMGNILLFVIISDETLKRKPPLGSVGYLRLGYIVNYAAIRKVLQNNS